VYLLYLLIKDKISSALKIICSICCLILLAGLIQLSSKSILVVLFLMIDIVLPYYLLTGHKRVKFMIAAATVSAIIMVLILNNNNFKQRYINELKTDLSAYQPGQTNEPRLARWHIATQLIKTSPLIGHGSGSEIKILGDSFYDHKLYSSYINQLNAHNQYLSFLLKSGVWGLAIYLLVLAYGFKIAIGKRDVVFISFMLLMAIVSLSENVLDVDKGVFFYGFFFTFFLFSYPPVKRVTNSRLQHNNVDCLATN